MTDLSTSTTYGRNLLICDPTCVLPYGHTVPGLNHFRRQLAGRFEKVRCIASDGLPAEVAHENDFEQGFTFLYNHYLPIISEAEARRLVHEHPAYRGAMADPHESIATADAQRLFERHDVREDDVIFFPGADFYGVIGLINAALSRPPRQRPRIHIRLIGVLESAAPFYDDPLGQFFQRLKAAAKSGLHLKLSAETPAYADHTSMSTGINTFVTPYPETLPQQPFPEDDAFNVLCAGSARLDKGFHHLFSIAREVLAVPRSQPIRFVSQTQPLKGSEAWDRYTSQLYALRNVTLLEPVISSDKMHALYRQCDIVLLPYAQDVYRLRGSAVMMEAASVGRLCLTLSGTAFARQVEYYGLGDIVDTINEMPAAIKRMADAGREELAHRIRQARERFFLDVRCSYENWFQPEVS